MSQTQIDEGVFFDPFACFSEAVKSARRRNHRYVQALLVGDKEGAATHRSFRDFYLSRAREWHDMIDWSAE